MPPTVDPAVEPHVDRRSVRRRETIDEILRHATEIMAEDGVNGLSLAEVARRLGVRPPSLYKYFDSLMSIYDELFLRGQRAHLVVMRDAMAQATPGLTALQLGLEASGRWALANRPIAELLFWRPVPRFEPSAESMAASWEMIDLQRGALRQAVSSGELGAGGDSMDALYLLSTLIVGVLSQAIANEPDLPWGQGRFTSQFPRMLGLFVAAYPLAPAS